MPKDTLPLHVRARVEAREAALKGLGYRDYKAYLKSPHWFDVRRAYQESDLPQRCMCGSEEVQYHHLTYERIGAERLTDLMPLCRQCHQMVHALERRGEIGLNFEGFEDAQRAMRYRLETTAIRARAEDEAPLDLEGRVSLAKQERNRWRKQKKQYARVKQQHGTDYARLVTPSSPWKSY
jgi:hypothetical protein